MTSSTETSTSSGEVPSYSSACVRCRYTRPGATTDHRDHVAPASPESSAVAEKVSESTTTLIAVITHDRFVYVGAELAADPLGVIVLGSWDLRVAPRIATRRIRAIRVLTLAPDSTTYAATVAEFAEINDLMVGDLGTNFG